MPMSYSATSATSNTSAISQTSTPRYASAPLADGAADSFTRRQDAADLAHARGDRARRRGCGHEALNHYARAVQLAPHEDAHRRALWQAVRRVFGGGSPYPFAHLQLGGLAPVQGCRQLARAAANAARSEFLRGSARDAPWDGRQGNLLAAGRMAQIFAACVDPSSLDANVEAAAALHFMDTWHAGAEPFLRRAAEQDRSSGAHAYKLGMFYRQQGMPRKALAAFAAAHARSPQHATYRDTLTAAARAQHQVEQEQLQLQRCPHAWRGAQAHAVARHHSARHRHQDALPHLESAIEGFSAALVRAPDNAVYRSQLQEALHTFVSHMCHIDTHSQALYARAKEHARTLIGLNAQHRPLLAKLKHKHSARWWRRLLRCWGG